MSYTVEERRLPFSTIGEKWLPPLLSPPSIVELVARRLNTTTTVARPAKHTPRVDCHARAQKLYTQKRRWRRQLLLSLCAEEKRRQRNYDVGGSGGCGLQPRAGHTLAPSQHRFGVTLRHERGRATVRSRAASSTTFDRLARGPRARAAAE